MRLINTKTLELEVFYDSEIPRYAILSHRWEGKELTLKELRGSPDQWKGREVSLQGFESLSLKARQQVPKVATFCQKVLSYGLQWAWVDTCCIDKTSSAELSESINSMFRWYRRADICYAYLNDVVWQRHNEDECRAQFRKSEWFQRGWTLQELLAPTWIVFHDKHWQDFGNRNTLTHGISLATGITGSFLNDHTGASAAMKMSWVANRKTSRIEDMAYCLLGLFDINMPMLYGEGEKAFLRLQLEIIKGSDDESIFAWVDESRKSPHGMLAPWPTSFAKSGDIVRTHLLARPPYAMTNKGLELRLGLPPRGIATPRQTLVFRLACERQSALNAPGPELAIELHKYYLHDYWQRVDCYLPLIEGDSAATSLRAGAELWRTIDLDEFAESAIYVRAADPL
jgi:hypothetical protein